MTAVEGGAGVVVTVRLSAAPEREVVIPLTSTATGGATAQGESGEDYAGIPESLTFGAQETEKTFTVTAVDDSLDDDDEGVTLSFGFERGVGARRSDAWGAEATATVSLTDDDDPYGDGDVRTHAKLHGGRGRCGGGRDGATERRAGARGGDTAHVGGNR